MADELLFDSERQEKKARKRRLLRPAIALAAILVLAVVIALILRSVREPVHKEGEDGPYPFTWQLRDGGSLLLELPHPDAPDYRWTLAEPDALENIEVSREAEEKDDTTRITVKPLGEGRAMVELKLLREGETAPEPASKEEALAQSYKGPEPEDVLYERSILLQFTREEDKLTGTVLSSVGVQRQGLQRGGEDSANPYRIYAKDEKRVVAAVKIASLETDWSCEILSGEGSVSVEAILYDVGEVRLCLDAGETPGESELVFRSEAAGAALRLKTSTGADGVLLVTEHRAEYGEKTVVSPPDGEAEGGAVVSVTAGTGETEPDDQETQAESGEPLQKKNDMP